MTEKKIWEKAAHMIHDAGGELIGRTRLQKVAYLLNLTGQGDGFVFEYRQFDLYSEELAEAIDIAKAFHLIEERLETADWGGRYSVFTFKDFVQKQTQDPRAEFIKAAAAMNAVELELAATAVYFKVVDKCEQPWEETQRRKPIKAGDGRLEKAKLAYQSLCQVKTPQPLPAMP